MIFFPVKTKAQIMWLPIIPGHSTMVIWDVKENVSRTNRMVTESEVSTVLHSIIYPIFFSTSNNGKIEKLLEIKI